jgi:23S rRNA (cytosine1962-C5)-methyltransferase
MTLTPAYYEPLPFDDYALLDSGDAWKLERYGDVVLVRPDPQALWRPRLPRDEWEAADLVFERESDRGGSWRRGARCARSAVAPAEWMLAFSAGGARARFVCRPTPFKHIGLFPEQAVNWAWLAGLAPQLARADGPPRLLNLFGYTGAASVVAAQAGYAVTHVDASRASLSWARENAAASGLPEDAWRSVLEDAPAFAQRERRRAARYEAVLLDPPHYGRGPKGEKWQLEEQLAALVDTAHALLAERAVLVLSTYAIGCSPLALANLVGSFGASAASTPAAARPGAIEAGELVLREEARAGLASRLLPCGYCARLVRGL